MTTLETTVREHGTGERRWFCGGGVHTWLATEAETGGAYLLFEDALDAGKVTPLHQHPDADETFYLLEGEVLLHVAGREQAWPPAASRSSRGACRTLSRSSRPRRGCSASRPRAAARPSTGTPASRPATAPRRLPTSDGSARPRRPPARSRSSGRRPSSRPRPRRPAPVGARDYAERRAGLPRSPPTDPRRRGGQGRPHGHRHAQRLRPPDAVRPRRGLPARDHQEDAHPVGRSPSCCGSSRRHQRQVAAGQRRHDLGRVGRRQRRPRARSTATSGARGRPPTGGTSTSSPR